MALNFATKSPRNTAYDQLVLWILLAGAVIVGAIVTYDTGFLSYLYAADTSRISVLITVLFLVFSAYCLIATIQLGRELGVAESVSRRLDEGEAPSRQSGRFAVGDMIVQRGVVGDHLSDVLLKRLRDSNATPGALLDSFISQFRSRTRLGTYGSDVLYKLGMLGTVIGFIQMLATMDGISQFDPETLRNTLQQMTSGMATALLTTIAGLVTGLILRVQFNLLEAVAARVIKETVRIDDIYLAPEASVDVRT